MKKLDIFFIDGHASEGLKALQDVQLGILKDFKAYCEKNDLSYFLVAGSALGAVRHNNIIPWDDDIDVGMMREDYERLLKLIACEPIDGYFFESFKNDDAMLFPFSKLRKNGTFFGQEIISELNAHHGIFIDIFPYDRVSKHRWLRKIQCFMLSPFHIVLSSATRSICEASQSIVVRKIRFMLLYLRPYLPIRLLKQWQDKLIRIYGLPKSRSDFVASFPLYGHLNLEKSVIQVSKILPVKKVCFANFEQPIPNDHDAYLTKIFGNYMQWPSEEKRVPPHAVTVQIDPKLFKNEML